MSLDKTTVLDRFNHMQDELSEDLESIVNVEECNQMISFLEKNEHMLPPNVFYMLLDNKENSVTWSMRLFKYMGYPDTKTSKNDLKIMEVLTWIRPEELPVFLSNAIAVYREVASNPQVIRSYKSSVSYHIEVHMRRANGKYFHLLQQSIAMGVDRHGQLVSHLNIYTIIADGFRPNVIPLSTVYYDSKSLNSFVNNMHSNISKVLTEFDVLNFRQSHKQIIEAYREDNQLTVPQLGKQLKLSENSIRKYQKDILQTINGAFGMTFTALKPALQSLFISKIL